MRLFLIIEAIILSISCCLAQQEIWYLNKIPTDKGLSQTENSFLYTDENGYTWISSLDGINLFDGKNVKVFKPSDNDPFSVKGETNQSPFFEDKEGNIWFTTNEAINCYKKSEGYFINNTADGSGTPTRHIATYFENDQFLWVISNSNLYRYNTLNPITSYKPIIKVPDAIRSAFLIDEYGKVNTAINVFWDNNRYGVEIIHFSENFDTIGSRQTYFDNPQNDGLPLKKFSDVISDPDGKIWLINKQEIICFDEKNPSLYLPFPIPNQSLQILSVTKKSERYFRVLLSSSEVLLFDKFNRAFTSKIIKLYDKETRSELKGLYPMFQEKDSIIWFGEKGSGIYFGNTENMGFSNPFDYANLEKYPIHHIFENDDGILFTNNSGKGWLFDSDNNFLREVSRPKYFKQIKGHNDEIWSISTKGISINSNDTERLVLNDPNTIYSDLIDYDKDLLILGDNNNGITFFDKKTEQIIPSDTLSWVVKLFKDQYNRLWTGNIYYSLQVWKTSSIHSGKIDTIKSFSNVGLINDIVEDVNRRLIWVATSKGLLKIDSRTLKSSLITEYDGLPNQFIYSIVLDKNNTLWLSTNKGIINYAPENLVEPFKQYVSRDGLSADEYHTDAAILSKSGKLYFGSTNGIDVFQPEAIKKIGRKPKLAISSLKIFDKEWIQKNTSISCTKKIDLPWDQNTLTFQLAALEYTDPKRNQFKVYLDNGNKVDSTFLGTENSITYANLSPGDYIFKFTACNAEGIWQEKTHDLAIKIHPPFYQTNTFRLIAFLLIAGLISFISTLYFRYQLREKQLQLEKQEREADRVRLELEKKLTLQTERTRIAGEMHDEIGSGLSTIRNASAKASRKNNFEDIKKIVDRVSQISINLINNMRGIIWAMDPDFDSLEDLSAYIRRYAVEYLDDNSLDANIKIPDNLPEISMNGQSRHNISLAVKEVLHNIVKHADASLVHFEIKIEKKLEIIIMDDGKGFDMATLERRGHGLRNIAKRAQVLGGEATWNQNQPKGTIVKFVIPLDKNLS